MKSKLLVGYLVAFCLVFAFAGSADAASGTIKPDQFPNGATDTPSNNVVHARLEVQFTVTTLGAGTVGPEVTVTLPSELTLKTGITARSYTQGATAQVDKAVFVARSPSTAVVVAAVGTVTSSSFQVDITTNPAVSDKLVFEWDMITPANFTQATAATIDVTFPNSGSTEASVSVNVSRKQNSQLSFITFTEPTLNNDTTSAEGTGYKITFPGSLPDLVHDDNTKSTASTGNPNGSNSSGTGGNSIDDFDDMIYRFWASTDSTLVKVTSGATRLNILEMKRVPTSVTNATLSASLDRDHATIDYTATPSGLYQSPTSVDESLVTELFTTRFADANLEGLVDTRGLAAGNWFIYISTDKTGDYFLGRSGRLVVKHAPGFLSAAWDGDQTGDFSSNAIVENTVDAASVDDAYNLTLDSGQLFTRTGAQAASEIATATSDYKTNVDLAFVAVDYDNPTADVAIFVSTNSGLTSNELTTSGSSITGLTGARMVSKSDTLTLGARRHNFKPEDRISVLGTDTTFVVAGSYTIYFTAFDGTNKTVEKASDLSTTLTKTALTLTVKHSPKMNVDPDLFDSGTANLNKIVVNTGSTNATGKPQRSVRISWEQNGLRGVKSVETTPTIDLFYSTATTYTTAASLKADVGIANDVHKITKSGAITLSNKAKFQNHFDWDLWTFVSAEGTVPAQNTDYTIYAIVKAGSTERLARFDNAASSPTTKSVRFTHDSYIAPILPAKDVTVGPDDPVVFTWTAADVDNAGGTAGATGLSAPNGTSTSPDIMIILSATDFGATSTRSALNVAGNYVANSRDGDDTAPAAAAGVVRLKEGVDTSFVWTANKMTTTIAGAVTSIPAGTYTPYIIINGNALNVAAAPFVNNNDFAYRVPGKIVLTSTGGSNPTGARFVFPTQISASSGELVRIPIVAEDGGVTVGQANIFVSVDTTYFEPVDKNPVTAGIQPFTLGTNAALSSSKIIGNTAQKVGNKWRLDFIYQDASGFTFLDGFEKLVDLHLKARKVAGTVNTTVTIENDPSAGRQTSLYLLPAFGGTRINTTLPGPSNARIDARGSISGTVVLEGRTSYAMPAADVTFFLRMGSLRGPANTGTVNQSGGFDTLTDSDFLAANDSTSTLAGVQKSLPSTGAFTLSEVPAGDYTLVVFVDRYLAGQREVSVKPNEAVTGIQPTLNGLGQEKGKLLAGDAAGYDHDGLPSTNTRPDNFIDGSDLSAITAAIFAKPLSQGGTATQDSLYRAYPYADVDGNGEVGATDITFATVNTTTINGTNDPVKPSFNLKPVGPNDTNANAVFLLAAAPSAVKAGETFDVTVLVKGAVAARSYEFHLGYDPSKMQPEGVVSTGDLLSRYGVNLAERDLVGDYGVVGAAVRKTASATGDGSLATVRFRALQGGPAAISLLDGLLIDSQLQVEKPRMDGSLDLSVAAGPMKLHDASGAELRGLISLDDAKVDFNDFFAMAESFGSKKGAANFNPLADLNEDGAVDFNDFFVLAENFGKTAVDAPVKRSSKPVGARSEGTISLAALHGAVKPGQTVTLDAVLSGAEARGVGFTVTYDATRFEFVESNRAGEQALFLVRPDGEGRVSVARAEGSLDGSVAHLTFRAKGEFEEPGRFQIADGLILGADGLIAQIAGGSLEMATTPAQFALNQNFPNPFNPETTIKYNLADDAQVQLRIYNIVGQVVRTLVQDRQVAGRYSIRWDGRDDRGVTVSSGIYFYQITAGKFRDVRKLMLLK